MYEEESGDEAKTNVKAPTKSTEKKCRSCGQVGRLTNRSKNCLNYKYSLPSCAKGSIDFAKQVDFSLDELSSGEDVHSCVTSDCDQSDDDMECTCHSLGLKCHTRACPLNPRHRLEQTQTKVNVNLHTNLLTPQQDDKDTLNHSETEVDNEKYCICGKINGKNHQILNAVGSRVRVTTGDISSVLVSSVYLKRSDTAPSAIKVTDIETSSPSFEQVYCSCVSKHTNTHTHRVPLVSNPLDSKTAKLDNYR